MICPFLEEADARCGDHFSLTRLSDAFTHCVGRYQACPVYQRLLHDRAASMHPRSTQAQLAATSRIAG